MGWKALSQRLLVAAAVCGLAACDAGPKAAPSAPAPPAAAPPPGPVGAEPPAYQDPRDAPVPRLAGRPIWSANSRFTAEENARHHFERDGAEFGARTLDDFVAKAHAFTARPPRGTLRIERRNGDRLLYDPASNTFAVVTRAGAPRTMFRPREGRDYWNRQVQVEAEKATLN